MFYHGVMETCNGFVYSIGAALLALDEPWKVLYRTNKCILTPQEDYELTGNVPNVVFPCAAIYDKLTGRIAVYYGAADSYCCVAYTNMDDLLGFLKENSKVF